MMTLLCKQKALYIKACVIANGITDSQGDTLKTTDIKKIFTSFNNQDNFELNHNNIPINEVSLIENYINATDEKIGNLIVPRGSWLVVIRVDNPEIKKLILNNEIQGISLYNYVGEKCKANLNGTVRYQDIIDKECVIPVFISVFTECFLLNYSKNITKDDFPATNCGAVLSILTLQFIPIEYRQKVVKKVYESLNKHGVFIFVEKIIGDNYDYSELYEKLYYDMKSINGYSIDEIRDKRLKLEGVLVPCTNQFNIDLLKQGGFSKVDIFWKDLNFVGYIAMK